jgi:hypothetical protein
MSLARLTLSILLATSCAPHAFAHDGEHDAPEIVGEAEGGEARWLAGDHHIHSRYSVGWKKHEDGSAPSAVLGGDAIYPIPMNALMARRYGLEWMVATDHGGPNHSKVNHDRAYPELLISRQEVPEVVQFFGMEIDTPGADHSSAIIPQGDDEAERLRAIEHGYSSKEAWPSDPDRNTEPKMLEALKMMQQQTPKPVVIAHHPSRSSKGLGEYGMTTPTELRGWNDTAPEIAVGMEGAPGHQAALQTQYGDPARKAPRGIYGLPQLGGGYPTLGGFDQMTALLGGFWDSMLGEGRRWWITANSDSHVHWTEGGVDFWPGEYSKTYVHALKQPDAIIDSLRKGNVFVTTGDLIDAVDVSVSKGGETLPVAFGTTYIGKRGEKISLTIRFRVPQGKNANGDNPAVTRVDLIRGSVTGKGSDPANDRNPTTRVEKRFTAADWRKDGDYTVIEYRMKPLKGTEYIRLRGTSTDQLEPLPDSDDTTVWDDLWFYSNPVFLETSR